MKISRIIIISFVVFVVGSTLLLLIDSKNHKTSENVIEYQYKTEKLGDFSVLVAQVGSDVHVNSSDTNTIDIEYTTKEPLNKEMYKLSNDTLYVSGGFRTYVKTNRLTSIITHENEWLGVESLPADTLRLQLNGGYTQIDSNGGEIIISALDVTVCSKARFRINSGKISNINILVSDSSEAYLYGEFELMSAVLRSNSRLSGNCPQKLHLEREKSCSVNLSGR
jgi:hypothetical protein